MLCLLIAGLSRSLASDTAFLSASHGQLSYGMAAHPKDPKAEGVFLIGVAKIFFILTSYGTYFILPRILGSTSEFGRFASVINISVVVNSVLIVTCVQSVSRFTAAGIPGVRRQVLLGAGLLATLLTLAGVLASPWVARDLLLDKELTSALRVVSLLPVVYVVYGVHIGALNGEQLFRKQALFDISSSVLRTLGTLVPAAIGYGYFGSVCGLAAGALALALFSVFPHRRREGSRVAVGKLWLFALPLASYHLFANGVLQVDLVVLKSALAKQLVEHAHTLTQASEKASSAAGLYRAAQAVASAPYHALLSTAFVLFPLLSQLKARGDEAQAQQALQKALRFALLLTLGLAAVISGNAKGIFRLSFPSDYLVAAPALSVLVFAHAIFALVVLQSTALNSDGRPVLSTLCSASALLLIVLLIPQMMSRTDALLRTAYGTLAAACLGLATSTALVRARFGVTPPVAVALRASAAACASWFAAKAIPQTSPLESVGALAVGAVVYFGSLVALREVRLGEVVLLWHQLVPKKQ